MTTKEIKIAIKRGIVLVWDDPDPIKGNDYTVNTIVPTGDGINLITYNNGRSEAEVFNHELSIK